MTQFATPINNVQTTVAASYTAGSGSLTVADGSLFGSTFPIRISVSRGGTPRSILRVSGRTGNVLTILGSWGSLADANAIVGDVVEVLVTAETISDLNGAVTAVESTVANKSDVGHTHAEGDITGLVADLAGKASTVHTHAQSDVTNLTTDLAAKAADNAVVHLAGAETISGTKTFSANILPVPFTFGGFGVPTTGTVKCQPLRVDYAATAVRLTLTCLTAPSGNFTVVVKRSSDSGATYPDTVATVTITSGNKLATSTTMTTASLAAGDLLTADISAVNGAADWSARLTALSRN